MRHMDAGRRITIRTRLERERLLLEVIDTGPGIPAEIQSRIFEPFFTTKPQGEGTGLGLSLCKRMLDEHETTITAESEVGRGTTFRIELPVVPRPAASLAAGERVPFRSLPAKKVLIARFWAPQPGT